MPIITTEVRFKDKIPSIWEIHQNLCKNTGLDVKMKISGCDESSRKRFYEIQASGFFKGSLEEYIKLSEKSPTFSYSYFDDLIFDEFTTFIEENHIEIVRYNENSSTYLYHSLLKVLADLGGDCDYYDESANLKWSEGLQISNLEAQIKELKWLKEQAEMAINSIANAWSWNVGNRIAIKINNLILKKSANIKEDNPDFRKQFLLEVIKKLEDFKFE